MSIDDFDGMPGMVHLETDKKYLVYRYVSGKGQPNESTATDQLPASIHALLPVRPR
ncbi:hypothetical protein [Trinickia violacea]|uniref:hypothetical protein n=1 Tax=Trinickia violacea TaxID=2571746 RepID=UPI00158607F1|nr:hypothetical protein [Trinickia violacea]